MSAGPIKVGTMVLIVKCPKLAGATGQVVALNVLGAGVCLCGCGRFGFQRGYGVQLARPLLGDDRWCVPRRFLVPLEPPGDPVDEHAREGLGIGAVV